MNRSTRTGAAGEPIATGGALVGSDINTVLALDAQVRQNRPVFGNLADSQPFVDSLARAPMTGCTSILDRARIAAGFNPLDLQSNNQPQLEAYVKSLQANPLFVTRLFDHVEVHRKDKDWNQVIDEIVALYPVASADQRNEIRDNLMRLINLVLQQGISSARWGLTQHTLENGSASIGVFVYISSVQFERRKDGKEKTRQLDFRIDRAVLSFQTDRWNEIVARETAAQHFKALTEWLDGMNARPADPSFVGACFRGR